MSAEETPPGEESEPAEATSATKEALPVFADPATVDAIAEGPAVVVRPSESLGLIGDMRASTIGAIVVLLIVAVQQIAWIIEPDVFGTLINAVTDEARTWQDLLDDLPRWGLVVGVNTIATALRRLGSDFVYTRMYARVAEGLARRARNSNADPRQTAALSELGRDFVSFFEDRIPEAMTDLVTLVGVTGFLFSYDTRIGAACLAVMVPILVTVRLTSIAITRLTTEMHELREKNVEVFGTNDPAIVLAHFTRVSDVKRAIGRYTAGNQLVLRIAMVAIFVVVLYVAIDVDSMQTGTIFAISTYLWSFGGAIETLPEVVEHVTAVRDLRDRLSGKAPVVSPESDDDE